MLAATCSQRRKKTDVSDRDEWRQPRCPESFPREGFKPKLARKIFTNFASLSDSTFP